MEENNKRALGEEEQGVTSASLPSTLPGLTLFAREGASRVESESGARGRTHCVSTRLNGDELAQLQSDARACHQRMGAVLRKGYFAGQAQHVPAVNVEKWEALASALSVLQCLALGLNAGQLTGDVRPALAATIEELHALRADLIGQAAKGEKL